jgi:energy-coupling factor transporter ATP-binding protein EcfA2
MAKKELRITALPTRYEGLVNTFGDKAKTTFVASAKDLEVAKRLIASSESAAQGKLMLIEGESGSGKTTFIHSLNIFAADRISNVIRLPLAHELALADIPGHLAKLPVEAKYTIINFDGREAPDFTEPEYRTFLGEGTFWFFGP